MSFFYYFAVFLLARRLLKSVKYTDLFPKWKTILNGTSWGVMILYVILESSFNNGLDHLLAASVLAGILYYVNNEPDFSSQKAYVQANWPLVGIGFINGLAMLVAKDFHNKYNNYFQLAIIAGFGWILGRWVTSKKQDEELRISKERRWQLEALVKERTVELVQQKEALENIVEELRATQDQLIQSEKMASLGELTAGIAHEIQNPLNFVNNFSEVSMELVDEMAQELENGDKEEAIAIAGDIKQNLEKIIHHGKRADAIVKGMLQHSRASSNTKEATDVNKLADEYLRLAYHGLRAKDKSFNAEMVTGFGENLPTVNIVPQDVGRVLLNLYTNAFYAVHQKLKSGVPEYKPTVTVNTSAKKGAIIIEVKDNGSGIPENIREKIMQPFFTTKPTGEGTGLGLSMSYDIVVKGHGGTLNVDSKEGEYTKFTVTLPA